MTRYRKGFQRSTVETFEHLNARLGYDPATGEIWWLPRPLTHFSTEKVWKTFNTRDALKPVGSLAANGYLTVRVDGYLLLCHRVAWILASGAAIPDGHLVDHINGNKADNRLRNLRLATKAQNGHNSKLRTGRSLPKGVIRDRQRGLYRVEVRANNQAHHGGRFATIEEATAAARALRADLHGEFANHGDPA